jgi:hypothetical protein
VPDTDHGGITAIEVGGFKSLVDTNRIEVRPLTILAGANSSGKSSIMQPLLLLKQTLDATYDPGPLLLDGPNVRFTSADQFLSNHSKSGDSGFSLRIEATGQVGVGLKFKKSPETGIEVTKTVWHAHPDTLTFTPNMSSEDVYAEFTRIEKKTDVPFFILGDQSKASAKATRIRCFLTVSIERSTVSLTLDPAQLFEFGFASFPTILRRIIHVPGLRGNPERAYRTAGVGQLFPGTFETYVAGIIDHWKKSHHQERLEQLASCLRLLGLTSSIDTQPIGETRVELRVGRVLDSPQGKPDLVNIADVGLGVSQVLPVVVALLAAEPGQLVYIEQPEIHLHPKAQVALAHVLADAARRGVRVVAETHSQLLLLGIQTLVAKGELDPALIKLHWFQRDEEGVTTIASHDVDENGAFGEWPEDFADVSLSAESDFLDAATFRKNAAHGT